MATPRCPALMTAARIRARFPRPRRARCAGAPRAEAAGRSLLTGHALTHARPALRYCNSNFVTPASTRVARGRHVRARHPGPATTTTRFPACRSAGRRSAARCPRPRPTAKRLNSRRGSAVAAARPRHAGAVPAADRTGRGAASCTSRSKRAKKAATRRHLSVSWLTCSRASSTAPRPRYDISASSDSISSAISSSIRVKPRSARSDG